MRKQKLFCKKLPYDDLNSENSENNPEREEKPIAQNQQKASEDYHGGDESTQSIPNSPNQSNNYLNNNNDQNAKSSKSDATNNSCSNSQSHSQNQGSQDSSPDNSDGLNNSQDQENQKVIAQSDSKSDLSDSNTFDTLSSENSDESDVEEGDDGNENKEGESSDSFEQADDFNSSDDQQYSYNYNTYQVVDLNGGVVSQKYYSTQFYRFLENFAEEKTKVFDVKSCDEYNVKKLMFRAYERRPLSYYKQSRIRDAIVLILDNSGSMDWWSENLQLLASLALNRKDVEAYIAPNGWIEEKLLPNGHRHTVFHDDVVKKLKGRRIMYVGDFDGANTPIVLSWANDVIWICPEERYRRFKSHDWVHYDESYFKGVFIRAWSLEEMFQGLAKVCRFGNLWIDFHTNYKFDDDY
jgi:hypothetical protein